MQEVLAGTGIAVGVMLAFSVQIANSSITASAGDILHAITGQATLQVTARDSQGFDARLAAEVGALPGVERAAPLLEQRASIAYGGRRVAVDFVGIDPSLSRLGGLATGNLSLGGLFLEPVLMLPKAMGDALGLPKSSPATDRTHVVLEVRGRAERVAVGGVVGGELIGALASAQLAAASLPYAQKLTGLPGRITRVLVVPKPGQESTVRAALVALGGDRLKVASVDYELQLLKQATGPNDQATGLFAIISVVVGLLFTFNAMLLTAPERRQVVAELRIQGFKGPKLLQVLGFQAFVLGTVASVVGLVLGYLLATATTHSPPGYLSFAFPLGVQHVVKPTVVVLAFVAGVFVTCAAAAPPLLDLRRDRAVDAVYTQAITQPGHNLGPGTSWVLLASAVALVGFTSLLLFLLPSAMIFAIVALAFATLFAIPAVMLGILNIAKPAAERWRLPMLELAVRALRVTTLRSLALAATGAVAIFGSVAIEGSHDDLLNGLYQDYAEYVSSADIWVAHRADDLALEPFDDRGITQRVRNVPGVAAVRPYYGGLLDLPGRRAWIIARSRLDTPMIPQSQILDGDLATATARLRAGGWATASQQLADAQHAHVGGTITLPTPSGNVRYRLAATTTNLGWGPGAVILNSDDYRHAWPNAAPSALEVDVAPGANAVATRKALQLALGTKVGLDVQTTAERKAHANALARAGLARLSQISWLLLLAAGFAMAVAMSTALWQRRPDLAHHHIQGLRPRVLWRSLLIETGLVIAAACITGTLTGLYGHYLLDRWLRTTTGFPAPFTMTGWQTAATCAIVAGAAFIATAITGNRAANAPTRLALATDT